VANLNQIAKEANRVKLAITGNRTHQELYGCFEPTLDEVATLRRVALFAKGSGRANLNPAERFLALDIINDRFDRRFQYSA